MEIRLAALGDIAPICALYNEFFAYNSGLQPQYYRAAKEGGGYPKSVIADQGSDLFLAVEDGSVLGLLHIVEKRTPPFEAFVPRRYAEIIDFFVTARHRKKGIGSKLMEAAKQWAGERELDYVELSVLSNAGQAVRFYQRNAFAAASHTMRYLL